MTHQKILALEELPAWRNEIRRKNLRLVATNGCFDILHVGHVTYLEAARQHGDLLLVGLNGDQSVRALKGPSRPVNPEQDRARVLAALECVGAVCIFKEVDALHFLSLAQPDVYVKGGDYNIDTINQDERRLIEAAGGRVVVETGVAGKSTTAILQRAAGGTIQGSVSSAV